MVASFHAVPQGVPLLRTKLYVPPVRPELVSRPRLVECLNGGLYRKLTLISAPAGSGKTTLLNEWIRASGKGQQAEQQGTPIPSVQTPSPRFAWLSLDGGDNDPLRFWRYVVAALQAIEPSLQDIASMMLPASPAQPLLGVPMAQRTRAEQGETGIPQTTIPLAPLLNQIATLATKIVLVLDDYHHITSQSIHQDITFLIEHQPQQLHLVISTRVDPSLSIFRLRARGQLTELRAGDLRFTPEEAAAFLNTAMGLDLRAEDVAALEARTEGWIVGLQLAALSMQGRPNARQFIAAFTGSHRYVLEYLSEEVLRRQPEAIQAFLLRTSILERLCGSLCDAVLDENVRCATFSSTPSAGQNLGRFSGSQSVLEYLERTNLFLIPLDDERHWYRYHHLFADLLNNRLRQAMPQERISELHHRASAWYAETGLVDEAVQHALKAQDYEQAVQVIERNLAARTTDVEITTLLNWMGVLPADLVRHRPLLCIIQAWASFFGGSIADVEPWLRSAEQHVHSKPPGKSSPRDEDDAMARQVLGNAAALRALVADRSGDLSRTIGFAQKADELLSPKDIVARSIIPYVLGRAYRAGGDLARADQACAEMVRIGREAGNVLTTAMGMCELAILRKIQGRLNQAADLYEEALRLASGRGSRHLPLESIVDVGFSDLLRERNELDAARQRAERVVDNLEQRQLWGMPTDLILIYTTLAQVLQAQGEFKGAFDVLERAVEAKRRYDVFPEFSSMVDVCRVRLWLAQGALIDATHWAAQVSAQDGTASGIPLARELEQIALSRVLIAQGRAQPGETHIGEALRLLTRLAEAAEAGGRWGRLIEILVLQALAIQAQGDTARARTVLGKSLSLAAPEGYVRVFVDEGEPLVALLSSLDRQVSSPVTCYVEELLAALGALGAAPPGNQPTATQLAALVEPLTQREHQVLQLICEGHSNQRIADELVVTLSTVKKHTSSIYGKLGVSSRTQAIAQAHRLGLTLPDR